MFATDGFAGDTSSFKVAAGTCAAICAIEGFGDFEGVWRPATLVELGVIKNTKTDVKLLGNGDLKKKLTVRVHAISATAREKIEGQGGRIEEASAVLARVAPRRRPTIRSPGYEPTRTRTSAFPARRHW
jgi:hypothetical protein